MGFSEMQKKEHINELQRYLHDISYYDPNIPRIIPDGIYGIETSDAVRAFQRQYGLNDSGETNPATWLMIVDVYRSFVETLALSLDVFPREIGRIISVGEDGLPVLVIQSILLTLSPVREAVYDLLHDAADIMLGINQSNSMLRKLFSVEGPSVGVPALNNRRCTHITPLLRYQMFVCILRKLSDMQSNYPVIRLSDNKIRAQLDNLLSLFFDSATRIPDSLDALFCCPVPSMQRMLFSYEKCIKLTTMAGDEKNKSMLILQKYEHTP